MKLFKRVPAWLRIAPAPTKASEPWMQADLSNYAGGQWAPGGFVSQQDEIAQLQRFSSGPFAACSSYAWSFPFEGRQNGDEHVLESYQWGWIPTNMQLNSAVALQNIGSLTNHGAEYDTQDNPPLQNQLIQAMYRSANAFWQEVRISNGTGWGYKS